MPQHNLDIKPLEKYNLSRLRFIGSVGEPLNPEAVTWGWETLNRTIHDNWWQTETGGIMIANFASQEVRPGSMGRPFPGVEAAIVRRITKDSIELVTKPGVDGVLALKPGWPSMFRGYLHEEERYRKCFVQGWYITGDLAMRDADGYFWFVGRADDIIKTAGHMVGPFEVESALMEHPAVAEAGVIGKPNPVIGELAKAFVSLKPGYKFDADTRFYGGNAIVGGGLPLAVGLTLADKKLARPHITCCFFGDGAVQEGEFHQRPPAARRFAHSHHSQSLK